MDHLKEWQCKFAMFEPVKQARGSRCVCALKKFNPSFKSTLETIELGGGCFGCDCCHNPVNSRNDHAWPYNKELTSRIADPTYDLDECRSEFKSLCPIEGTKGHCKNYNATTGTSNWCECGRREITIGHVENTTCDRDWGLYSTFNQLADGCPHFQQRTVEETIHLLKKVGPEHYPWHDAIHICGNAKTGQVYKWVLAAEKYCGKAIVSDWMKNAVPKWLEEVEKDKKRRAAERARYLKKLAEERRAERKEARRKEAKEKREAELKAKLEADKEWKLTLERGNIYDVKISFFDGSADHQFLIGEKIMMYSVGSFTDADQCTMFFQDQKGGDGHHFIMTKNEILDLIRIGSIERVQ